VAVVIMGVWLATRTDALLLVVATQLLQMLRQLAPIIRADGYHILSDLIGVPDLFQHIKPTLAGLLPTNWGKSQPLRRGPRWVVRAWVLTVVPLLLWLVLGTVLLLPRLVATAWVGLGQQQRAVTAGFQDGDVLAVGAALLQMFSLVLPVAAGFFVVGRIVRKAWRSAWDRTADHPGARGALMLLVGVVLVALLLAWWPSGQYEPVSAHERGTLPQAFQLSSARRASAATPDQATPVRAPIDGATAQTGYALVPRDPDEATVLLVRDDDGELRGIVTEASGEDEAVGVAFPFALPDAPGEGDNQALAVNTGDGTVVYDVSVALVWVKDGEPVTNTNEAYALASCANCTTVAVAFQVVLVVGQSDAIAPVNVAVAANGGCLSCQTLALATQLVITLDEMPSQEVQDEIEAAFAGLDGISDLQTLYDQIHEVEREIVTVLLEHHLIDPDDVPASLSETSTASTTTTAAGPSGSSTTSTTVRSTTTTAAAGGATSGSSTTSSTTTSTTVGSTTTTSAPTTETTAAGA
jgi:putative peptide zinc metalloprotease protein